MMDDTQKKLAEWISEGLAEEGKTSTGLGQSIGSAHTRISEIVKQKRRVQLEELAPMANYLGRPIPMEIIEELMRAGRGSLNDAPPPAQRVPIVSWVSAGSFRQDDASQDIRGTIEMAGLPKGDWIALRVDGDSMDRISPPDSIVIVNRADKRLVPNGCYIIGDGDGQATYKRYRTNPVRFEPVSVNTAHEPIFPESNDHMPEVIGRVKWTILEM